MLFPEKRELTPFPPLKNTKTIPRYKIEVVPEKEKKIRVVFEKKKNSRPFPKTETPQRRICPRQVYSLRQKQLIERHVALDEPKQKDKYNYRTLKETAFWTYLLAAAAVVRTDNRLMYHSPEISGADGAEADEGKCADAEAGAGEPSGTGTGVGTGAAVVGAECGAASLGSRIFYSASIFPVVNRWYSLHSSRSSTGTQLRNSSSKSSWSLYPSTRPAEVPDCSQRK